MVKKVILWVVGVLVAIVAIVYIAFQVSPLPGALIIQRAFSGDVVTDKERYGRTISKVSVDRDVSYPSDYSENTVDIFYPKGEKNEKHPVLFWLHGGGFVAGDKEGVEEFAAYLVADTAYTVVSVNYQLAPSSHYPGQLLQFGQGVDYFQDKASDFPMIDFDKVMIGGDSAGAQIAAQFVATQTNPAYLSDLISDRFSILSKSRVQFYTVAPMI